MRLTHVRKIATIVCILLCLSPLAQAAPPSSDITAQPGQVDPYRTRSELLMKATKYTGVFTPEQAAATWAEGLKARSAALQYTVMTDKLQKKYARQLDTARSNWVTGVSSPWVESFVVTRDRKPNDTHAEIDLTFETATAAGPFGTYKAKLWMVREGEFWRIERIWTDEALYPYTLYTP